MSKWKFLNVQAEEIEAADINANSMSEQQFKRLTDNIQKSGGLSSAITCWRREKDGKFVIISGHHRYRASVKLCFTSIPVIYADEKDLINDEIIALQISHNSLHGSDDNGILKKMFEEIKSLDFKEFAYVNVDEIGELKTDSFSFVPEIEQFRISVVLYKNDMNKLEELLGVIQEEASASDTVILAEQDHTEDFLLNVVQKIRKSYNIKSSSIAFSKLIELAHKQLIQDTQNEET